MNTVKSLSLREIADTTEHVSAPPTVAKSAAYFLQNASIIAMESDSMKRNKRLSLRETADTTTRVSAPPARVSAPPARY